MTNFLRACAQIADNLRRNYFACGNLRLLAPYFTVLEWCLRARGSCPPGQPHSPALLLPPNSLKTSVSTQCASIMMTSCMNHVLSIYAMCGQNSVFIIKPGGTYSNHSALMDEEPLLLPPHNMHIGSKQSCIAHMYNVSWLSFISNVWIRTKFVGKSSAKS